MVRRSPTRPNTSPPQPKTGGETVTRDFDLTSSATAPFACVVRGFGRCFGAMGEGRWLRAGVIRRALPPSYDKVER